MTSFLMNDGLWAVIQITDITSNIIQIIYKGDRSRELEITTIDIGIQSVHMV